MEVDEEPSADADDSILPAEAVSQKELEDKFRAICTETKVPGLFEFLCEKNVRTEFELVHNARVLALLASEETKSANKWTSVLAQKRLNAFVARFAGKEPANASSTFIFYPGDHDLLVTELVKCDVIDADSLRIVADIDSLRIAGILTDAKLQDIRQQFRSSDTLEKFDSLISFVESIRSKHCPENNLSHKEILELIELEKLSIDIINTVDDGMIGDEDSIVNPINSKAAARLEASKMNHKNRISALKKIAASIAASETSSVVSQAACFGGCLRKTRKSRRRLTFNETVEACYFDKSSPVYLRLVGISASDYDRYLRENQSLWKHYSVDIDFTEPSRNVPGNYVRVMKNRSRKHVTVEEILTEPLTAIAAADDDDLQQSHLAKDSRKAIVTAAAAAVITTTAVSAESKIKTQREAERQRLLEESTKCHNEPTKLQWKCDMCQKLNEVANRICPACSSYYNKHSSQTPQQKAPFSSSWLDPFNSSSTIRSVGSYSEVVKGDVVITDARLSSANRAATPVPAAPIKAFAPPEPTMLSRRNCNCRDCKSG